MIGPAAVDDKAEVEENPKLWTAQRRFTYDDEAVQQAFPDDTFSHKLSNGAGVRHTSEVVCKNGIGKLETEPRSGE